MPLLEKRVAERAPGYLESVRAAARRLGVRDPDTSDAKAAVEAVEELSVIDVDVPTASRRPAGRLVKVAVSRLVGWYLRYLGGQVTALGQAVTHMGWTLLDRTERLERQSAELQAEVARLAARIGDLESGSPAQ
jgi:hypothetical protein